MRFLLCLSYYLFSLSGSVLYAQPSVETFKDVFQLEIKKASGEIKLDGKLDEAAWNDCQKASDFWQKSPFLMKNADPLTEVKLTYDDKNIYVAAKCYQKTKPIIESLKRDNFWDSDGFAIVLDPINAKTNAYIFGSSAAGVQMDAIRGQVSDMNTDWSNKWYAEVAIEEGYYTIEMAIPFRILRFVTGNTQWGVNFIRNATFANEFHNWTAVPAQFWPVESAYAGTLNWDKAPKSQSGNYNIIPYISTGINKVRNEDIKANMEIGVDAKISIGSSLSLDLTANPDFSQIEVDELVTNLTRFNIFLPEKRTFFLDNNDVFNDFGTDAARPFFSRRIGLDGNGRAVPILFGSRLTGDVRPDLRMGLMNIQTGSNEDSYGQNYGAFSLNKKFGRSFIQGMFLNRQAFDGFNSVKGDYGRNASLELVYISEEGNFATWIAGHRAFKAEVNEDQDFLSSGLIISNEKFEFNQEFTSTGENYFTDMGYVVRIENYDAERDTVIRMGYRQSATKLEYNLRPENGKIGRHSIGLKNEFTFNPDWSFNERITEASYKVNFKSGEEVGIEFTDNSIDLMYPFTFIDDAEPLPVGNYRFQDVSVGFSSDDRKPYSFSIMGRAGKFYNGNIQSLEVEMNYRIQPWGNFGIGYQINELEFPDPYGSTRITALQSKVEVGFNRNLLWTSLFQYVDQSDFMGINSRLQWRFKPMSDLFLVYVDNYDIIPGLESSRNIVSNNRALVLKLSYWY